jgi:hypothetical protein
VTSVTKPAAAPKTSTSIAGADALLIVAVVVAGIAAAHLAVPALWVATPMIALTLLAAATSAAHSAPPALAKPVIPLPPRLERSVAEAFAVLPAGEARDLLDGVVGRARTLLATLAGQADERRLARDVTDLVDACSEIAREHARLDAVLPALWEPALAPAAARGAADDAGADELRRRGDAGRQLLTKRLREAATVMEQMVVQQGVERSDSAAQRVAELTSELAAEAAARRHAAQEIRRLLEGRG